MALTGNLLKHLIFMAVISAALALSTYSRNSMWLNELTIWKDVVKKSPLRARGHYNLGTELKNIGAIEEAVKEYEIAIQVRGWDPILWNNIGVIFFEMGLTDRAKEFILKSIRLHSADEIELAKAHNNLASIYYKEGRFDEAIMEQKIAVKINPSNSLYYYSLAIILSDAGNIPEAMQYFREFLKTAPPEYPVEFIGYAKNKIKDLSKHLPYTPPLLPNPLE